MARRTLTWPIRRFLEPHFQRVRDEIAASDSRNQNRLDAVLSQIGEVRTSSAEKAQLLEADLRSLRDQITGLPDELVPMLSEACRSASMRALIDAPVDDLPSEAADLLNYAEGHRGFRAQRGLWFNDPVSVSHRAGDVTAGTVNERIVEAPYVYRALGGLGRGARLLDLGGAESTVALSLASLGYQVTTIDLRPYPLSHPQLTSVGAPFESLSVPDVPFDAAICLSSIEHFGLGAYGEGEGDRDADRRALDRVRQWLRPGGLLVLTVPFGDGSQTETERTYDLPGLEALLEGWEIHDLSVACCADHQVWRMVDSLDALGVTDDGVALVTAGAPDV